LAEPAMLKMKYKQDNILSIPVIHLAKVKSTTAC